LIWDPPAAYVDCSDGYARYNCIYIFLLYL
jgi:hypothetical protein